MRMFLSASLFFAVILSVSPAATFEFVYQDAAGFGFNDATVVAPINGNTGTTLGDQRKIVLEEAARLIGVHLESDVPIRVQARFQDFGCTQFGATLASAGPFFISGNFSNRPVPNTTYPIALANSLAGQDLFPTTNDIRVNVNSALDVSSTCLGGNGFYYGLDRNSQGQGIDLLSTLIHELGHGLGFVSLVNESTGQISSSPDIFSRFIRDEEVDLDWIAMTNAQRASSAVNSGNVVWTGPSVRAAGSRYLNEIPHFLTFPGNGNLSSGIQSDIANFGPQVTNGIEAEIVLVDDGSTANPTGGTDPGSVTDACQDPFVNAAELDGKIALIDRGLCNFTDKAIRAEAAGAIAVIIANNVVDDFGIGGNPPFPNIPIVGISLQQGNAVKAELQSGPLIVRFASNRSATNNGFVQLHAPSPVEPGSSISHFDSAASPNLLMEPSLSGALDTTLDLTLTLFRDIGWNVVGIPIPHETYNLWAERVIPSNVTNRGLDEDADSDGATNFEEYAFGSNPISNQSQPAPVSYNFLSNANSPFVYLRNRTPVDVEYELEESSNLSFWDVVPSSEFTQNPLIDPNGDLQQVDLQIQSAEARNFFRIKATKLPNP